MFQQSVNAESQLKQWSGVELGLTQNVLCTSVQKTGSKWVQWVQEVLRSEWCLLHVQLWMRRSTNELCVEEITITRSHCSVLIKRDGDWMLLGSSWKVLFYFIILFYFILFYFILFYFILFLIYFILFYFILFYFILFYFIFNLI